MSPLDRRDDHPLTSDIFQLLVRLAQQRGEHLEALLSDKTDATAIQELLWQARSPIRLHGRRVEEMFVYVVASLGHVRVIKREDCGELVAEDAVDLKIPDFRLLLNHDREILVEVKNVYEAVPNAPLRMHVSYLRRLQNYARLFGRPLYVAVHWSKWRLWSLHAIERLIAISENDRVSLRLTDAIAISEMRMIGDMMLGTVYPLTLRIVVDSEAVKKHGSATTYRMTIRDVEFCAKGIRLTRERDKQIAWGLMLHGRWREEEPVPIMDNDVPKAIEFHFRPEEMEPDESFAIVSSLSSLASVQFNELTVDSRGVSRLRPDTLPIPPYPSVGEEFASESLPLWRFILRPRDPRTDVPRELQLL
jgi:hypothetical protein